MNFKTKGIVLIQRSYNNEQKYLTILTRNHGLIEARLRIFGQITRNIFQNITVLGYYHFNIFEGKGGYVIDAAEPLETFFDLRFDPKKLALAQYFCELTNFLVPSKQSAKNHISLLLNSLWLLEKDKKTEDFIKAVFELRLLSLSGYMPDLVCCKVCFQYENKTMYYLPITSKIICSECIKKEAYKDAISLPKDVLHAMRYIIYKEDKAIFGFKIGEDAQKFLNKLTEYMVTMVTEKELTSLLVYRQF